MVAPYQWRGLRTELPPQRVAQRVAPKESERQLFAATWCVRCAQPYRTAHFVAEDFWRYTLGLEPIQDALWYLSAEDREFMLSGLCPQCFHKGLA